MARILIIDDDNQFRGMLRIMLENAGYKDIEEAANGSIGMKLFQKSPFDLVITDIVMPNKEGIETIMELTKSHPGIKIIAISGGGRVGPETYLEMAKYLGASRTLEKPFEQSDIINAVSELLNK